MPERFDTIVAAALNGGGEQFHEAKPSDFGPFSGRRTMFVRCLEAVVQRYPEIRLSVSGERAALIDMGLMPHGDILIAGHLYRTAVGPTVEPGTVRLTFTRRERASPAGGR